MARTVVNKSTALFLAEMCQEAYALYKNDGEFSIPKGYKLVKAFKATSSSKSEWFGFIIKSKKNIVIAFRGTVTIFDWLADINISQTGYPYLKSGKTHEGFTTIYSSCRDEILSAIKRLNPYLNLYITGHSLGAALAVLCAPDIATNSYFRRPRLYTFATPRVGNPKFTNVYNLLVRHSISFLNIHDTVTYLPPKFIKKLLKDPWLYKHVERKFLLSEQANNILDNHGLETYIKAIEKI